MALQTSIAQYFNSRKRRAVDELKKVSNTNKVLILDKNESDVSDISDATSFDGEGEGPNKKIIYNDSPKVIKAIKTLSAAPKLQRKTPKTSSHKKLQQKSSLKQGDIRKSLLASFNSTLNQSTSEASKNIHELHEALFSTETANVPFEIKGPISPRKTLKSDSLENASCSTPKKSNVEICTTPSKLLDSNLTPRLEKTPVKGNLSDLKSKLIKSNRLNEIRSALKKINEGHEKLKEIESKIPPKSPSLKKFKSIEIEVTSPTKACQSINSVIKRSQESPSLLRRSLLLSPGKTETSRGQFMSSLCMSPGKSPTSRPQFISPRKLFSETSSSPVKAAAAPAFERHSALLAKGKPTLVLPFKYRSLAETFRAVDTVVSMLFNRSEAIFFSKLKASVQQMTKKNLTESHLGQIQSLCSDLFSFKQEKLRPAPGRADKYELTVTPVFDSNTSGNGESNKESGNTLMTPNILLERKRKLYHALLEKTKDFHQEFLLTLDPPIILDKNQLSRWHPEFDVDGVPDIIETQLPKSPNVESFSSAKDVLTKARDIFNCNPRMEKALERVSDSPQQSNSLASASIPALKNALKGIPASLLEKIRAKQAAKAAESLTRNPQTSKLRIEYSRLPELARIIRNIFVVEKRNILPKALLFKKIKDSFREVLTPSDMEHHLKLLMDCSSDWLTTIDCRKEIFYKLSKNTEMSKVFNDIQNALNKL